MAARRWKPTEQMRVIGRATPRANAHALVTGQAKFGGDIRVSTALVARCLTSPHPNAAVVSIDLTKAESMPGVKAIWTVFDSIPHYTDDPITRGSYAGHPVAAVAATSAAVALDAIRLIEVEYEVYSFAVVSEDAMKPDAPNVLEGRPNVDTTFEEEHGDTAAAISNASALIEGVYETQFQTHSCLEPTGGVHEWDEDGNLTAWCPSQAIFLARGSIATTLRVPQHKVRVISEYVGGGFGSKIWGHPIQYIGAELARRAQAPVRFFFTREEEQTLLSARPSSVQRIRLAADADGRLSALEVDATGTCGLRGSAGFAIPYIYTPGVWRAVRRDVYTNTAPSGPIRAMGKVKAAWGMERAIDDLADALDIDPLEFRLKNDPNPLRRRQLRHAADLIGWYRRESAPSGTIRRGFGVASGEWKTPGGNAHASVEIHSDGKAIARCGAPDIGTGLRTVVAVVVAEE